MRAYDPFYIFIDKFDASKSEAYTKKTDDSVRALKIDLSPTDEKLNIYNILLKIKNFYTKKKIIKLSKRILRVYFNLFIMKYITSLDTIFKLFKIDYVLIIDYIL